MGAQILWFQSHELKSKAEEKGTYLFWLTRQLGVLSSLPRFKMLQLFVSLNMVKLISRQRLPFLSACFQVLDEKFEIVPTGMDFAKGVVGVVADSEHETFKTWIRALFKNFDEDLPSIIYQSCKTGIATRIRIYRCHRLPVDILKCNLPISASSNRQLPVT